jgi:hypothetical protein
MNATTAHPVAAEQTTDGAPPASAVTVGQSGSVAFPEVVRAHYDWERAGCPDGATRDRFREKLQEFELTEGELTHAYWATKRPSAVGMTVKPRGRLMSFVTDHDATIRLHRVTDWLAREAAIADLLHHCDTLAIKVSEVLRGTTERIAMQWLFTVQSHLLGFVERTQGRPSKEIKKEIEAVYGRQRDELIQIERYYVRAGTKAARIVYFWGMMIGVAAAAFIGLVLAFILWRTGWFDQPHTRRTETFFISFVAGGVGAVVSVLMRMSSNRFRVDYEVGRATIRRLGSFRPLIGSVFGMAVFFLFMSEILQTKVPTDKETAFFFFGILAFFAGFNERWTNVLFGKAERTIAGSLGAGIPPPELEEDEEEED